jgi:hypothetical protein
MQTSQHSKDLTPSLLPPWPQGVVVAWTLIEVLLFLVLLATLTTHWGVRRVLDLVVGDPAAIWWIAVALAGFLWLGDIAVLLQEKRAWRRYQQNRGRHPKLAPLRFGIHLLPGIGLARHLAFAAIWLIFVACHVGFLLIWDVAFLLIGLPGLLCGPLSTRFGRATDFLDEMREQTTLFFGRLYRTTDPLPVNVSG